LTLGSAVVSKDKNADSAELVNGGETPSVKVLKKRLKRTLKDLSKGEEGFFMKAEAKKEVQLVCDSSMDQDLHTKKKEAQEQEEKAIAALRKNDRRTRIGLITLATGKTWGTVGMKWLSSANKYFCADQSRFSVHLLLLTDMPTLAHIQACES
jgi:hypothetical protein